jgi:hypothetical protein
MPPDNERVYTGIVGITGVQINGLNLRPRHHFADFLKPQADIVNDY